MRATLKTHKVLAKTAALFTAAIFVVGISAGAEWKIDTVDQSGSGQYASIKIDQKGNVHAAYVPDVHGHPLKYAFWDHTLDRWFSMNVAGVASFCTLVLDSKQRPNISYADHGTGKGAKLRYVVWSGGAEWTNRPVSPNNDAVVAYYTSVALDKEDKPYFSYYDYEGPAGIGFLLRLRSVFWTGKYWEVHMVDRQSGSGKFNDIAIDSTGRPHIAYGNVKAETSGLRYGIWDGEKWKTEILEGADGPRPTMSVAFVLDKKDIPHITYSDAEHNLIKYATKRNGQWVLEVVDAVRRVAYPDRNGIALDENGNPHMSYYDSGDGLLKVASRRDGKWYREVLARDYAGFTSSMQIHDGVIWVAFADDGAAAFKVARRRLVEPAPLSTQSQATTTKIPAR
jgi:hypothetical protein